MIELSALKSLHAVAVSGSVVGAASALGYTPSAVSQQIKRLERQAGVELLERAGRGVLLTEQGRLLVTQGRELLDAVERIESQLHAGADRVQGDVRLAAFSTSVRGLVAPAARRLAEQYADLDVTLVEIDPWEAVDLVASGQVDVAVVHNWATVPLVLPEHLEAADLMTDRADLLVHRDHRLAKRRTVTPQDLVHERWISTAAGSICHEWLLRMYDGTGAAPKIAHWSGEFASHIALVAEGLGVALNPRLGRGPLPKSVVAVVVTDPVPSREVRVLWRRTMAASPAVKAVVETLQETAA